jgi:hypothetical protein
MALWSEMSAAFSSRYEALLKTDDDRAPLRAVAAEIHAVARWYERHQHLPPTTIARMLEGEAQLAESCR